MGNPGRKMGQEKCTKGRPRRKHFGTKVGFDLPCQEVPGLAQDINLLRYSPLQKLRKALGRLAILVKRTIIQQIVNTLHIKFLFHMFVHLSGLPPQPPSSPQTKQTCYRYIYIYITSIKIKNKKILLFRCSQEPQGPSPRRSARSAWRERRPPRPAVTRGEPPTQPRSGVGDPKEAENGEKETVFETPLISFNVF